MHLNPCCKAAVFSGDTVQSPSPSLSSVAAPGISRLQFTVPPSMYWVINYAIFPRIRRQREQQSHSSQHLLFLFMRSLPLPFSSSALSGRYTRYLVFPSSAPLSGAMPLPLGSGCPPRPLLESSRSWAQAAALALQSIGAIGYIVFLTSPSWSSASCLVIPP